MLQLIATKSHLIPSTLGHIYMYTVCVYFPAAQREFTVQPDNFTTYEDTSTGQFPEAPFKCTFGAAYNGVRPVITWEVRRSGGSVKSVSLPDLQAQWAAIDSDPDPLSRFRLGADTVTYRQVIFQRDHTGHFQLHFPDRSADDRMNVRCVATHPDDPSQSVRSNWATLFVQGNVHVVIISMLEWVSNQFVYMYLSFSVHVQ